MAQVSTPTPNPFAGGYAQTPNNNAGLNPYGSAYATAYSLAETNLIAEAIERQIYDAAPQQYDALKLLNMSKTIEVGSDEFVYKEKVFGRTSMTVHTGAYTSPITLSGTYATAESIPCAVGDVLFNENGTPVIVTAITPAAGANAATIAVACQSGGALPTFNGGEVISFATTIIADGMDTFRHYDRLQTIERYNYVQLFQRNSRWSTLELQKMENMGTTDYLMHDKSLKIEQLRVDMFAMYMNGTRGNFPIAALAGGGTDNAKMMGGLYPTMIAAGAPEVTSAISGLQTAFETLAFATNFKKEGATRMIYATDEILYELSKVYKESKVRYEPDSKTADLNLYQYNIGNMKFVPVSCELFREDSVLPTAWAKKMLVVDQSTINPVKIKGIPSVMAGVTDNMQKGGTNNFQDWWVQANLSVRFRNPQGGFAINIS